MKNSTGNTHGDGSASDSLEITESELNDILSRVNDCITRHDYTVLCGDKDDKPKNSKFLNDYKISESQMLEIIKDLKWENFCPPPMVAYDRRFKRSLLYVFKVEKNLIYKKSQYSHKNPLFAYDDGDSVTDIKSYGEKYGFISDEKSFPGDSRDVGYPNHSENDDKLDLINKSKFDNLVNIYIKFCLVKYKDVENLIIVSFHESTSSDNIFN